LSNTAKCVVAISHRERGAKDLRVASDKISWKDLVMLTWKTVQWAVNLRTCIVGSLQVQRNIMSNRHFSRWKQRNCNSNLCRSRSM